MKKNLTKNFSEKLNTDVYIEKEGNPFSPTTYAYFVYNNVIYTFFGKFINSEELMEIINNLEL